MSNTALPNGQETKEKIVETAAPRLLAVDDVSDSAELIARIAERSGYDCRYTCDPTTVADLVREWDPAIVVTDISMPGMDAIELVRVLKDAAFKGDLLFVSGLETWLLEQAGKLATMCGLKVRAKLQKPVDVRQLRQHLARENTTA